MNHAKDPEQRVERLTASDHAPPPRVLLIDDQPMIADAVRTMIGDHAQIELHYVQNPSQAIQAALTFKPSVILQDLVMPDVDGLTLVRFFKKHPDLSRIPLVVLSATEDAVVKAEAFALGANDYLVKLPDKVELLARLTYHANSYHTLVERDRAFAALKASQEQLAEELAHAAAYIRSLLPSPTEERISVDWRFIPSASLGGDTFGYHWIDQDHFAVYLIDVCGHGLSSALLSISVLNVLRAQTLPQVDFRQPTQVLEGLNRAFPMEQHNYLYFTAWYGVFQRSTNRLFFSDGGHPPAFLLDKDGTPLQLLKCGGPIMGAFEDSSYPQDQVQVGVGSEMFVYSDGLFECVDHAGSMVGLETLQQSIETYLENDSPDLDHILAKFQEENQLKPWNDDVSVMRIGYQA